MTDSEKEQEEIEEQEAAEGEESSEEGAAEETELDSIAAARNGRDADFSIFETENKAPESESSDAQSELQEMTQKYLRALADLENFKKRSMKERSELLKYQGERIFIDLLEVIDNFDRALESAQAEPEQLREGVELIHRMFNQVLEKWEVRGESAVGEPFDPNKHDALSQMPSDEQDPGTVLNELEKAFFYKDKLIRPAKVVVAVAPAEEKGESDGGDGE